MSSIPFERYDDEFQSLTLQVRSSLQKGETEFTSSLLLQCEDLLKQMSVEARGVEDASIKRELLQKVRSCKTDLGKLREEATQAQSRIDLLSGGSSSNTRKSNAAKERLLDTTNQVEQQNETLDKARRVMADTEEVALEITTELGRNRESLESAHGRVREMSGLTNRARRLLQNMSRRATQQRLALYGVGGVIVVTVAFILWHMR